MSKDFFSLCIFLTVRRGAGTYGGGIALGVDRLVMLLADAYAMDEVQAFLE